MRWVLVCIVAAHLYWIAHRKPPVRQFSLRCPGLGVDASMRLNRSCANGLGSFVTRFVPRNPVFLFVCRRACQGASQSALRKGAQPLASELQRFLLLFCTFAFSLNFFHFFICCFRLFRGTACTETLTVGNRNKKHALGSSAHASVGSLQNFGLDAATQRSLLRRVRPSSRL